MIYLFIKWNIGSYYTGLRYFLFGKILLLFKDFFLLVRFSLIRRISLCILHANCGLSKDAFQNIYFWYNKVFLIVLLTYYHLLESKHFVSFKKLFLTLMMKATHIFLTKSITSLLIAFHEQHSFGVNYLCTCDVGTFHLISIGLDTLSLALLTE